MARGYSVPVPPRHPLPDLWLLSDARNDQALEGALARLPKDSGFVFRHYHLPEAERRARFAALAAIARERSHTVILSRATGWGEDGVYGRAEDIADHSGLRLATAHNLDEIAAASRRRADGVFLSPVFPTRSHSGGEPLGKAGFHRLAALSEVPVIALGGMTAARARELGHPRWGAIDGLAPPMKP